MAATYTKPFSSGKYNPNLTRGTSSTTKGSEYFFKKLKEISEEAADLVVKERADTMWFVLSHRFTLKGGFGRYPKWQPDPSNRIEKSIKSKESYKMWKREIQPNGNINITNTAEAKDGFSYPLLLLHGEQGSYKWGFKTNRKNKGQGSLFSRVNAEGFSTQMPKGITPWLNGESLRLKEDLKKAIGALT